MCVIYLRIGAKYFSLSVQALVYVVDGKGKLFTEGKTVELKESDAVLIQPNEKYYYEGVLKVIPACFPAWTAEQVEFY